MIAFHNPYAFIPVVAGVDAPELVSKEQQEWPAHLTHDRWVSGTHSGRLIVRITLEDLTGPGGEQTGGEEADRRRNIPAKARVARLFKIPGPGPEGTVAIPSTTLRGMIGSLIEAASHSALRVLDNTPLKISLGQGPGYRLPSVHDYFRSVHPDLLPLARQEDRRNLTLGEQLMGVIEEAGTGLDQKVLALASRLRFSMGVLEKTSSEVHGTSKILASPKPNSPFYYRTGSYPPGLVPKNRDTANHGKLSGDYYPQGRKAYLHRNRPVEDIDWKTHPALREDSLHQKADVTLLSAGAEFWFHVDFDNLTDLELQLLCYAIRPSAAFRHKLGMGKPLGMGRIRLDPAALCLVDRLSRYTGDPAAGMTDRYTGKWNATFSMPSRYVGESRSEPPGKEAKAPTALGALWRDFISSYREGVFLPVLDALETIGDPAAVGANPVHYPQPGIPGDPESLWNDPWREKNGYRWFSNQIPQTEPPRQGLLPVSGRHLPELYHQNPPPGPQPPDPARPKTYTHPSQMQGEDHKFVISEKKGNKLKFRAHEKDFHSDGFLKDQNEKQKVLDSTFGVGKILELRVLGFSSTFQLEFPPGQDPLAGTQ